MYRVAAIKTFNVDKLDKGPVNINQKCAYFAIVRLISGEFIEFAAGRSLPKVQGGVRSSSPRNKKALQNKS